MIHADDKSTEKQKRALKLFSTQKALSPKAAAELGGGGMSCRAVTYAALMLVRNGVMTVVDDQPKLKQDWTFVSKQLSLIE